MEKKADSELQNWKKAETFTPFLDTNLGVMHNVQLCPE